MKINEGFILKEIAGNFIIISCSDEVLELNNTMISVNELGALIWNKINDGYAKDDIISEILKEYDVDTDTASNDFDEFVKTLANAGVISL